MSEIDLGGFLLQPIQRICRYPLQLKELKKTFEPDHELFSLIRFGSIYSNSLPVHFRSISGNWLAREKSLEPLKVKHMNK